MTGREPTTEPVVIVTIVKPYFPRCECRYISTNLFRGGPVTCGKCGSPIATGARS